jgi:hypothetical protein
LGASRRAKLYEAKRDLYSQTRDAFVFAGQWMSYVVEGQMQLKVAFTYDDDDDEFIPPGSKPKGH